MRDPALTALVGAIGAAVLVALCLVLLARAHERVRIAVLRRR
jgi:hypothetical protein